MEKFERRRLERVAGPVGRPVDQEEALEAARKRRQEVEGKCEACKRILITEPTMRWGTGEPLRVKTRQGSRLLIDGGGLCSPGLWPPDRRVERTGLPAMYCGAMMSELAKLPGGPAMMLSRMVSGQVLTDPFSC